MSRTFKKVCPMQCCATSLARFKVDVPRRTSPMTRQMYPFACTRRYICLMADDMKCKYFSREEDVNKLLSTVVGSCPSNQRRIQFNFPYFITCRYGGDAKINFALLVSLGHSIRSLTSCIQETPRLKSIDGSSSCSIRDSTAESTSTSRAFSLC